MKAVWNGVVIAESEDTLVVEGNHYFPEGSLKKEYFSDSAQTSSCPWKGMANYFDITVDGQSNPGAAWYYADPKPAAVRVKGRVAFWKGVQVTH